MGGIIYIDILYLVNFFLDAAAFWATARFLSIRLKKLRLLYAALIGGLASIVLILCSFNALAKICLMLLMFIISLYILFPNRNAVFLFKALVVYFLILFAMAGAVLGGQTLLNDITLADSWKVLIFAVAAAILMAYYGMGMVMQKWQRRSFCKQLRIQINGKEICIEGLIDTGNDLREPISRNPVIIAELSSLSALLPQYLYGDIKKYAATDPISVIERCSNEMWKMRLRLLPFSSIGGAGILLGFKPDMVIVEGDENIYTNEVVICIYDNKLAADCGARAIINPAVMTLPNIFVKKKVC